MIEAVLRRRLTDFGLGEFVERVVEASDGCLEFTTERPVALRRALIEDARFAARLGVRFEARQVGLRWCLHVKQFAGWPAERFQVHVDPVGVASPGWAYPIAPLLWLWHAVDYHGYRDIERVARALSARVVDSDRGEEEEERGA